MTKREDDNLSFDERSAKFISGIEQFIDACNNIDNNNTFTNTALQSVQSCIPYADKQPFSYNAHTFNHIFQQQSSELSEKDRQKLAYQKEKSAINIEGQLLLAQGLSDIKIKELIARNNEKLRYNNESHASTRYPDNFSSRTQDFITEPSLNPQNVFKDFISTYSIFKNIKNKSHYCIWDENLHHHININRHQLKDYYLNYLDETLPPEASTSIFKKSFMDMIRLIPHIKGSILKELPPYSVLFKNGILDVKKLHFTELSKNEAKHFYSNFCINLDYNTNISSPVYFNKVLSDISDNNHDIENLICEQFGAAICQNNPTKKIFIYQGCTDSGKTRLMYILKNLLQNEETIFLNTLTELGDIDTSLPSRFIHILELGENCLGDKSITLLKGYSDGYSNSFKIFISTNHAIVTGADGYIDPALKNRLSVVPFKHAMKNNDEDVKNFETLHLNNERLAIIIKCLKAYSQSLEKGSFSNDNELNIYIDNADKIFNTASEFIPSVTSETCSPKKKQTVEQILHDHFILTNNPNPSMTTEEIMRIINDIAQEEIISDNSWVGRKLKDVFGKDCIISKRANGNSPMYYNVAIKE